MATTLINRSTVRKEVRKQDRPLHYFKTEPHDTRRRTKSKTITLKSRSATVSVTRPNFRQLTREQRLEQVQYFVALCFAALEEYTVLEICDLTNLCAATIYRLRAGQFTLDVRYGTIQALGFAAKMKIIHEKTSVRVALLD